MPGHPLPIDQLALETITAMDRQDYLAHHDEHV
jgi:hypothetical protein